MCYIFERELVRGPQKQCSRVSDMQIQISMENAESALFTRCSFICQWMCIFICYVQPKVHLKVIRYELRINIILTSFTVYPSARVQCFSLFVQQEPQVLSDSGL